MAHPGPRTIRDMDSRDWVVVVSTLPGPDQEHPLIIRMTLSASGASATSVHASVDGATAQLRDWLSQLAVTGIDGDAT